MTRLPFIVLAFLLPLAASAELPEGSSPEMRPTTHANTSDMVRCFGKARKKHPEARGSVTMAFDVFEQRATATQAIEDTVGLRSLTRCMERRAAKWAYEDVEDGSYTWRFVFRLGTDARE
jgi:hypothetical protein